MKVITKVNSKWRAAKKNITSKVLWKDYIKIIGIIIPVFNIFVGILNWSKQFLKTSLILKNQTQFRDIIKWTLNSDNISIITLMLAVIIFLLFLFYTMSKDNLELNLSNKKIVIKFGDLFIEEALKVIPVNEYFDTCVDNKIIAKNTLHGKAIKEINLCIQKIDRIIEEELSLIPDLDSKEVSRTLGKNTKYPLGTTIEIKDDYIFTAFSRFCSRNRAYLKSRGEYVEFLSRFWKNIDFIKNNRDISIPLFGSGNLNLTDGCFTYQELLIQILLSLKISGINMGHNKKISIILHENLKDEINLYELKSLFKKI